jgi:rhomboid-like protein
MPVPLDSGLTIEKHQFATSLSAAAYIGAAAYTNEDTNTWSDRLGMGSWWRRGSDLPTDDEIKRAKTLQTAKVRPTRQLE